MLILTGSVVDDKTEALCSACHRVVGLFDLDELAAFSRSLDAIYCFECDNVAADSVHSCVYDESGRYLIYYDGVPVSVNIWREVRAKSYLVSQKNIKIAELYAHLLEVFGGPQS